MVGPGSDNSKPTDSAEHQSLLGAAKESTEKCLKAFIYEAGLSPIVSLHQFVNESTGKHLPDLEFTKPDSSMSSTVGSFLGDVAKYVILSKVVHSAFNPAESEALAETAEAASATIRKNALESATVGTVAGFLTPVDNGRDYWKEKSSTMVTSGAAFGTMGGTAAALSKTSFLSSEAALTRTIAISGIAGLAGGTIDSAVDSTLHNQPITLDKTIRTAATYGLFGAAFGGVAHAVGANAYVARPESDAIKIKTEPSALDQVDDSIAKPTLREHAASALRAVHTKTLEIGRSIDNSIAKINPLLALDNYSGMQLAYEGAGYHPIAQSARPYYSSATNPLAESRMLSVAHQTPELRTKSPKIDFDQTGRPGKAAKPGETTRRLKAVNDVSIVLTDVKTEAQLKPANLKSKKVTAENPEAQRKTSEAKSEKDVSTDAKAKKTYDITSVLNTTERGREFLNVLDQLKEEHPSFLNRLRASTAIAIGGRDSVVIDLQTENIKTQF